MPRAPGSSRSSRRCCLGSELNASHTMVASNGASAPIGRSPIVKLRAILWPGSALVGTFERICIADGSPFWIARLVRTRLAHVAAKPFLARADRRVALLRLDKRSHIRPASEPRPAQLGHVVFP